MIQGKQFNKVPDVSNANKVPTSKVYTEYTPAEREKLMTSILAKGRMNLTPEEQAFSDADMAYWGPDDDPWKKK